MPTIMHVVLQKLASKSSSQEDEAFLSQWAQQAIALKGQIPGLLTMHAGPCLEGTEQKAKGFDMILVCTMEDEAALAVYGTHPLHEALKAAGRGKFEDEAKIIYDFKI